MIIVVSSSEPGEVDLSRMKWTPAGAVTRATRNPAGDLLLELDQTAERLRTPAAERK